MNTAELRRQLLQDFADHREGKITNQQARTRAAMARSICETIKIEMAAAQMNRGFEPVVLCAEDRRPALAA